MALNKFMHPRNIYKTPPNFAKLAKSFEEFRNIAKEDISGKVSIDFKDPHALRVLTKCLLKADFNLDVYIPENRLDISGKVSIDFKDPHALRVLTKCLLKADFNLDVYIPENRLVPTLPLRLNYILWIEDLLSITEECDSVRGLDIGTGACAVYPLLAAVKNKWRMIGTETDEESFINATKIVERNNLENLIELRKNSTTSVIDYLFLEENAQTFDFSMCNPPFYTTLQELCESRSPARPLPKNGFTGSPQELITEGGELQFCRKMIEESKNIPQKVLIFTTMVGHKYNLKELLLDLKAEGIKYTTTEFCQGRVTRWGLAWTYQNYDFSKLEAAMDKTTKKNIPISFLLPELAQIAYTLDNVVDKIKIILQDLKVEYKNLSKRRQEIIFDIVAQTNTWSNQRRKRRLLKRIAEKEPKISKINDIVNPTTSKQVFVDTNESCNAHSVEKESTDSEITSKSLIKSQDNSTQQESTHKGQPILHATMKILSKDNNIYIEMEFLDGVAGKEGLHQIVQYIKNNWK